MKKIPGVIAIIALAVGLTWAAQRAGEWLGFSQQDTADAEAVSEVEAPIESAAAATDGAGADETQDARDPSGTVEVSAEVASIEEDLARIEEALESGEVLEEFTPSEPLSADNPVTWPTDI